MASDKSRRLSALEIRLSPPKPVIDDADTRKRQEADLHRRLEFACYLAGGRRAQESVAETVCRLLEIAPGRVAAAMEAGEFNRRWTEVMSPLRGLEGDAFLAVCETIRALQLARLA